MEPKVGNDSHPGFFLGQGLQFSHEHHDEHGCFGVGTVGMVVGISAQRDVIAVGGCGIISHELARTAKIISGTGSPWAQMGGE